MFGKKSLELRWVDERSEMDGSRDDHVLSSYSRSQPPCGGRGLNEDHLDWG